MGINKAEIFVNFLLVIFPYRTGNCANFSKDEIILNAQLWKLLWNLQKEKGGQKMRWLESITHSMGMNLSKLWEIVEDGEPGVLQSMEWQRVGHNLATEQQN